MILKIDKKHTSKNEIFKTEYDFVVKANEYYHENCTFDEDYDPNYTMVDFVEAKRMFEMEDYTIKLI